MQEGVQEWDIFIVFENFCLGCLCELGKGFILWGMNGFVYGEIAFIFLLLKIVDFIKGVIVDYNVDSLLWEYIY